MPRPPRAEMLDLLKRMQGGEEVSVAIAAEQYRVPVGTLKARMKRWMDAGTIRIARFGGPRGLDAFYVATPGANAARPKKPKEVKPPRPLNLNTATSMIQRFMTKYS